MLMDGSQIIDGLDSLWFFSNVFTSSRTEEQVDHVIPELTDPEEAVKNTNQAEESQQNDDISGGEKLVRRCSKCGEFAAEIESLKVVVEQVGQAVEELANKTEEKKKENISTSSSRSRRRRKRRSKRSLLVNERRQIFGELDLGFYGQMEDPHHHHESPWLLDDQETTFEYEKLGTQQQLQHHHVNMNMKKMPPLNDGLAMKQHLKSWAYAVACTVR